MYILLNLKETSLKIGYNTLRWGIC